MNNGKSIVYVKADQQSQVDHPEILLKDVCEIRCDDKELLPGIENIEIYKFNITDEKKIYKNVFTIMDIIDVIQKKYGDVSVISMGESDILVEYIAKPKRNVALDNLKVVMASILVFFGAAFTIMAFNNDISINNVFGQFYTQITGQKKPQICEIEISYALGLATGIIVFFDHIGNRKFSDDVTPIEVEINKHKKDNYDTLIDALEKKEG